MPAALKSDAFLLRATKYGEADQILTLYTRALGKCSCLAKNSRLSRQRFGSALQPFCKFEALLRTRPSGLGFLESALPLKSWPSLLDNLERIGGGYRLLELADSLEETGAVHAEFFDALEMGLSNLACSEFVDEAVLRSEARFLLLAGWAPRLDACVSCRREAPFARPRLSLSEGGLLCGDCRTEGSWMPLGAGCGQALQRLFGGQAGSVFPAKEALRRFVEYQLGKSLKSESFERSLREAL
jgi:DNA repair protein RecO (recombination protein O)